MSSEKSGFFKFSHIEDLMPQEEKLEIRNRNTQLTIGIPKEVLETENRISLIPDAVQLIVQNGHRVLIETGAGDSAHFSDNEYSEAGGEIVKRADEVFNADILIKVAPLMPEEIKMIKKRQIVFSMLNLTGQSVQYFKSLIEKKVTAISFEKIKDKTGAFPVIRSMSKLVGNTAILIASEYLSNTQFGKGMILGGFSGIPPTEVVILGAGTVAENASRTALGMGASVKVFDNSIYKLERLQRNLNQRIYTSIIQPKLIGEVLKTSDVLIGAIHSGDGLAPCIVNESMVQNMRSGSVIVDVSIDQGGCVETSQLTDHKNPVFKKYDVTHYCVPNMASRIPHTASLAFSNFFAPTILKIGIGGGLEGFLRTDYGFCQGIYLLNGIVTNKQVGQQFNLPYQDIDLLMAAFG